MMWWDGNSIMQEKEVHSLQPNTFVARGNIATPEGIHQGASQNVKVSNECGWWWEMCVKAENKHSPNWHYNPRNEAPGNHWTTNTLLTELIRCRSLGGRREQQPLLRGLEEAALDLDLGPRHGVFEPRRV